MATLTRKSTKASRKQIAEMEAQLKALLQQEKSVKKKLTRLECSIVAVPGNHQESRLKNWNTLPPPDEYRPKREPRAIPRVHQERIRQARTRQALLALLLVCMFLGFAVWFCSQLQAQHLLD